MDDAGNGNSLNVHDGDDVDDAIDNLTNRYDSGGENTLACGAAAKTGGCTQLDR